MAIQSSTASSVRERLPVNCFSNLSDDDEDTLEELLSVEDHFFSMGNSIQETSDSDTDSMHSESEEETHETDEVLSNIHIEPSDEDMQYMTDIENFRKTGCGYSVLHGTACSDVLGMDTIEAIRLNMLELPRDDLDLIILRHLQMNRINTETTKKTSSHSKTTLRKRASMNYFINGQQVCKTTYLFTYGIGDKRFKNISRHFGKFGLTARKHGNSGRCPVNVVSPEREGHVVTFIKNYADKNAMPLPGRMPRMRDYTVVMLPSDTMKAHIWKIYADSCASCEMKPVGLTTFKRIWCKYLPQIAVMNVVSDLIMYHCLYLPHKNHIMKWLL